MQRPADALRVASSIFSEGLSHLHAGRLGEALQNFEMSLSINQKYLQPASLDNITCFQQIAAVHDKLGNLREAAQYLERAKAQLAAPMPPQGERNFASRRKRSELLKQVQPAPSAVAHSLACTHAPRRQPAGRRCRARRCSSGSR